jgi:hypothetical protein
MIGKINGLVKAGASASLVAGVILATAGPAAAAGPNTSDGAAATGLITLAPVAQASFPGTSSATVASVDVAGLVTTGVITDTADATSSTSTIASLTADAGALVGLNTGVITSSCTFNTNTGKVKGTAGIVGGTATVLGTPIALDASPTKNETVVGLGGVATITLNQQTTAADGTLTVNAIAVTLLGTGQVIDIGTSTCNAADLAAVPVLPGKALPIGLGALGVLGLGGVGFAVTRRRRSATAAA